MSALRPPPKRQRKTATLIRPRANIAILNWKAGLTTTGIASAASSTVPDATCRASPNAATGVTARAMTPTFLARRSTWMSKVAMAPTTGLRWAGGWSNAAPRGAAPRLDGSSAVNAAVMMSGNGPCTISGASAQLDRLAGDRDALGPHLGLLLRRRIALDRHGGAGLEHLLGQAARLHAKQRRQRRLPDVALVFDRDVGVRVRPAQRLDRGVDCENLGGVVAAPAMMCRGGADRGDGHEDASSGTHIHDQTSQVPLSAILPARV